MIAHELDAVRSLGAPEDLLIMVPKTHAKGSEGKWVLDALRQLNVGFLDQVGSPHRRQMREPGQVRVVTYHSARGLEAARAIVFGFHWLGTWERRISSAHWATSRCPEAGTGPPWPSNPAPDQTTWTSSRLPAGWHRGHEWESSPGAIMRLRNRSIANQLVAPRLRRSSTREAIRDTAVPHCCVRPFESGEGER